MLFRRSQFLINRKFQLRFALYVCTWLFALSLVYPLFIQALTESFLRYAALDPMGPGLDQIQKAGGELMEIILIAQGVFFIGVFLLSIFVSHRIAGPIHKLRQYMEQGPKLGFPAIQFRQGDHFQELAESYNQLASVLRSERAACAEAARLIESGDSSKALQLLRDPGSQGANG